MTEKSFNLEGQDCVRVFLYLFMGQLLLSMNAIKITSKEEATKAIFGRMKGSFHRSHFCSNLYVVGGLL